MQKLQHLIYSFYQFKRVIMKLLKNCILFFLFLWAGPLFGQAYSLIETESPYSLPYYMFEGKLLFGYETGHIPDFFIKPEINIGIFNWWQIGTSVSGVYFIDQKEWRLSEVEAKTKFRLLRFNWRDFALFPYFRFRYSLGDPIIVAYTGELDNVMAAVSPRADGGEDYIGGFTTRFLLHRAKRPAFIKHIALLLGGEYARTLGRDYYQVSFVNEEDYRNRITISVAPAFFIGSSKYNRYGNYINPDFRKNTIMLAVDNKFTYWSEAGYMYDMVPQVNWCLSKKVALYTGVSIPIAGGNVYKVYGGLTVRFDLAWITADVYASPHLFSPDRDGVNDILTIEPYANSRSGVRYWKIIIYDPSNVPFITFSGRGRPKRDIKWNGRSHRGETVESNQYYKIKMIAWDTKGNKDVSWSGFKTDIMFVGNVLHLILFELDSAELGWTHRSILSRVALLLKTRFKRKRVSVSGHTCTMGDRRHNYQLSYRRAKAVRQYLIDEGIAAWRLRFYGAGSKKPIASNRTKTGRRKNRRVDFVLF